VSEQVAARLGARFAKWYPSVPSADRYLAAFNVTGPLARVPELRRAFVAAWDVERDQKARATP
jgi:hypothetical protein